MYNYTSEDSQQIGFIDKHKILQYVTEGEIFELVFGFRPIEFDYVLSPFRKDKKPGCWFERDLEDKLVFRDFNYGDRPLDCFDVVKIHYKLANFYSVLLFIKENLIDGKNLDIKNPIKVVQPIIKQPVEILIDTRNFVSRDAIYWTQYGISKQNLIDDKVFPIRKFMLKNSKNGDVKNRVYESCYAITNFPEGRKKLYFPYRKGGSRFITNCKKNDIGGINSIPSLGRQLIISKSYKDFRVLSNLGKYCIWIQNEGMLPDHDILIPIIKGFQEIIVWFDNDNAGITASIKFKEHISSKINNTVRSIYLPEELNLKGVSDPSDMYCKMSKQHLINFINSNVK